MRSRPHPVALFLLLLILSPYLLAAAALVAVLWLVAMLFALAFGRR